MKQKIYILTLALVFVSCHNQATEKATDRNSDDNLQIVSTAKKKQVIYVKDKSLYEQTFIDGLSDYNEPIKLIDNYILIGKHSLFS